MTYITGQPIVFVGTGQTYKDLKNLNPSAVVNVLLKWDEIRRKYNQNECCCLFFFVWRCIFVYKKVLFGRFLVAKWKRIRFLSHFFIRLSLWFNWKQFYVNFIRRNLFSGARENLCWKNVICMYSSSLWEFYLFSSKSCGLLKNILFYCKISKNRSYKIQFQFNV